MYIHISPLFPTVPVSRQMDREFDGTATNGTSLCWVMCVVRTGKQCPKIHHCYVYDHKSCHFLTTCYSRLPEPETEICLQINRDVTLVVHLTQSARSFLDYLDIGPLA
jgi:hypothetical protein